MEGENHPRNHRRERERERESYRVVFSACYFLVLTGGEEGKLFRAHARLSPVSHRRNADKGQRKPSVRRLFLWQPPSQTKDHPDVDVSYLVLDLKEKKREREVEKNRLDGKRGMAGGPVKRAGGKKKRANRGRMNSRFGVFSMKIDLV